MRYIATKVFDQMNIRNRKLPKMFDEAGNLIPFQPSKQTPLNARVGKQFKKDELSLKYESSS